MRVRAFAKINLLLKILRKRPDGFHDLETVFRTIDLYDELTLTLTGSAISVVTRHSSLPSNESNLCHRAARLLQKAAGHSGGVEIELHKRIPLGAGLGGGSSDAAAVLKYLNVAWNIRWPMERLREIGSELGSDVPFFLQPKPAYATGRGEELHPMEFPLPYWIVVATPPIHVSTTWAYAHCTPRNESPTTRDILRDLAHLSDRGVVQALLVNDFEQPVMQAFPGIRNIKRTFLDHGAAAALMSGSGSSVFGLFADRTSAQSAAGSLSPEHIVSLTRPDFHPPEDNP